MVLLDSEGEKYACEQCIKGHRVSSCQHSDRPLRHVNKKGRPVSQCNHCRGLRKSRATHTRCNCGEHGSSSENLALTSGTESEHQCPCHNGGKCTCALKKEPQDGEDVAKIATVNSATRRAHGKPHMANRRSEGNIPKIQRTYHPPLHRANNSAHETRWPYPVQSPKHPLARSPYALAQRSVDSLPLHSYVSAQRPSMNPVSQPKSEQDSPMADSPALPDIREDMPPLNTNLHLDPAALNPQRWSVNDFSYFQHSNLSTPQLQTFQQVYSADTDQSRFSWTEFDFYRSVSHPNMAYHNQNQAAPSLESVDYSLPGHSNLSRSVSGTTSEVGDSTFHFDAYQVDSNTKQFHFGRPSYTDWGTPGAVDIDPNRLSVSSIQTTPHEPSSSNASTFNPSGMDTFTDGSSPASHAPKIESSEFDNNFSFKAASQGIVSAVPVANSPGYTDDMNTNWDSGSAWDASNEGSKLNESEFAFIDFSGAAHQDSTENSTAHQPISAGYNWQ